MSRYGAAMRRSIRQLRLLPAMATAFAAAALAAPATGAEPDSGQIPSPIQTDAVSAQTSMPDSARRHPQVAPANQPAKSFNVWRMFEVPLYLWTAYHAQAAPHEMMHMLIAYTHGTQTRHWGFAPLMQWVEYDRTDDRRTSSDIVLTSLSAPAFSRLTCDLPRWVSPPPEDSWWLRWTSAYWTMSYTTTWVTLGGSWVSFATGDRESGWDFVHAARAISANRGAQAGFLALLTAAMAADAFLVRNDIVYNAKTLVGAEVRYPPPHRRIALQLAPGIVALSYRF